MQISLDKLRRIVTLAREFDVKVAPWDDNSEDRAEDADSVFEDSLDDPVAQQLKTYIDELNVDEQVHLVALMWVGRGTYEAEEYGEAVETARAERVNETSLYLLGVPLLADYLEEGVGKLGYSLEE